MVTTLVPFAESPLGALQMQKMTIRRTTGWLGRPSTVRRYPAEAVQANPNMLLGRALYRRRYACSHRATSAHAWQLRAVPNGGVGPAPAMGCPVGAPFPNSKCSATNEGLLCTYGICAAD